MITYRRFDHVHIGVPAGKEAEANLFYTEVMGFTPMQRAVELDYSKGYWYQLPGFEVHIGTENGTKLREPHFALEVADLAAARKQLEAHGITLKPQTPIAGRNRFAFFDPYGNRIELLEYL